MRSRQVTQEAIGLALAARHGPGVVRARQALELSDPLSGSIIETEARLLFREAGLPPPSTQHPFRKGKQEFLTSPGRTRFHLDL
jgi:hypothetical protein